MKKILLISKLVLGTGIILLSLNSCKKEIKQEDPKEVAEDQNEAKFDDSNSKENDSEFLVDANGNQFGRNCNWTIGSTKEYQS